jgi:hypothetical protein
MRGRRRIFRAISITLTAAIAAVFVAAAMPKIGDPAGFALIVYRYRIVPDVAVNLVAIYLPWTELIAAACLLVPGPMRDAGFAMLAALLGTFIGAQGFAAARGLNVACGCFSTRMSGGHAGIAGVLLDCVFLAALVSLWQFGRWLDRRGRR